MSNWYSRDSRALKNASRSLKVVDGLLSFMSTGRGKPSQNEQSLYAASIVFSYGIWEDFVERLVIESASELARRIHPSRVPPPVLEILQKKSAWDLTVHPGWKELWTKYVQEKAVGDGAQSYGLNTANTKQVAGLFQLVGVEDVFASLPSSIIPAHQSAALAKPRDAIDKLVELRGSIVHTGSVPDDLRKHHATEWRQFLEALLKEVDKQVRASVKATLK